MAVSSTGTATGTEVASQNYDTRPLTDSELEEVALGLSPELFRVGILLGLSAPWLQEVIADSNRENFGKCMEVLMEWRKTIFVEQERMQLAVALKRVSLGRLSVKLEPKMKHYSDRIQFCTDRNAPMSNEELDYISHIIATSWERVGAHLGIPQHELDSIQSRASSIYQKAYSVLYRWTLDCDDRYVLADSLKNAGFSKLAMKIKT